MWSLLLLLVVQAIGPTAQFLGETAQDLLPVPPGLWNDVGLDILDGALYLGFHLTGGLLEGLGASTLVVHFRTEERYHIRRAINKGFFSFDLG